MTINLRISVPVCSLRRPFAREYLETEIIPPPSTVYGMLLSMVGEQDRYRYLGTRLAIAITNSPRTSKILRTAWRVKKRDQGPGLGNNRRPDYQEILTGLEFGVWIADGDLANRINDALLTPTEIVRFGGLSFGESHDLVDRVDLNPDWEGGSGMWLVDDPSGRYPLPIWVDHVGSAGTRYGQYRIENGPLLEPGGTDLKWIVIAS